MEVYLDNAATTRVCPEAADIAYKVMTECYGNPSSTHTKGREAKTYLDTARSQIAAALGCSAAEVYFTSCGSESDVWAITKGAESMSRRGKHIISSAVEHDAVRKTLEDLGARGFEVTYLAPEKDGAISVESVKNALREDTILVTLMMVNNETGGITDIAGIAKMLKAEGSKALLHTDAVQGFMKVPFSAKKLGADMISISGHKIHAPKGIGALYIKTGVKIKPLIRGGAQAGLLVLIFRLVDVVILRGHHIFQLSQALQRLGRQGAVCQAGQEPAPVLGCKEPFQAGHAGLRQQGRHFPAGVRCQLDQHIFQGIREILLVEDLRVCQIKWLGQCFLFLRTAGASGHGRRHQREQQTERKQQGQPPAFPMVRVHTISSLLSLPQPGAVSAQRRRKGCCDR